MRVSHVIELLHLGACADTGDTHTHKPTHTHTHKHTHTHTHTHTHSLTHSLTLSLSLSLTHTHSDRFVVGKGRHLRRREEAGGHWDGAGH